MAARNREVSIHALGAKNKYIGLLFMKISPEYFALGREGIHEVSEAHAKELSKWAKQLTHVVCSGTDGRYDQVTIIEGDTLEEINAAATDFRMGAKARYITISDMVIGLKAPPRGIANRDAAAAAAAAGE